MTVTTFPCKSCGAELEFKPGTRALTCPHCGTVNEIPQIDPPVREIDFEGTLASLADKHDTVDRITARCDSCGASVTMPENVVSEPCPFCGTNIVATGKSQKLIKPGSLLPFGIDRGAAREKFVRWIGGLWFAPGNLRRFAAIDDASGSKGTGLVGVYLPYWTYDAHAVTPYTGQRGDDYWVSVPYTTTVNGRTVTEMRQERRTRWTWVSGTVENSFDDVLVAASASLPAERLEHLGGWDLKALVPYRDEYLAGFRAESYTVALTDGFGIARRTMESQIAETVRGDIGGDHQRIAEMHPAYSDITFKHILLPIWVAAYRYQGKVYRFLVNARTGQMSGERPYSPWKVAFVVLLGLVLIAVIAVVARHR